MTEALFEVGDLVRIWADAPASTVERFYDGLGHTRLVGIFEVIAVVPERDGQREYRIRGGERLHERVVLEGQIIDATAPQPRR